jgi:hypothetical protein
MIYRFDCSLLYSMMFISLGYGHITTKTTQGKIATILYSAFGVPLMMLFVANIGSTMAKMFAFVISRITMIFCCRISAKKKRTLALKNRQKFTDKPSMATIAVDGKRSNSSQVTRMSTNEQQTKHVETMPTTSMTHSDGDLRQMPANIRLNMLTGLTHTDSSRSFSSSNCSIGERSKDAIVRMNELIRKESLQDIDDDRQERRRSAEFSPIAYYINETNKLTSNIDSSMQKKSTASSEQDKNTMEQVHDDTRMKQVK